ncbi:aspartic peptidase domain-containing protein [Rhizophagus clarus]|uniref:Aspartic peptidase domain-containing protein n=1 Tax=Rhizophagus clarus TaxID=94130 RepID=A0A8H3MFB2_9GLOM|nr:aspartic peptidase domain-containing protein [Rhizophagus clarus]
MLIENQAPDIVYYALLGFGPEEGEQFLSIQLDTGSSDFWEKQSSTTFNLKDLVVEEQEFGLVDFVTNDFEPHPYDKQLDQSQFAFWLGRDADHGTNPERIGSDIFWSDLAPNNNGQWRVPIDDLLVNGTIRISRT